MQQLKPEHRENLFQSGLTEKVITEAGIFSVASDDIKTVLGGDLPNTTLLAFPYPRCGSFTRYKLFPPFKQEDGHTRRYFQKKNSGVHLYIPPGFNPDEDMIRIVEGEKKALKGTQDGLNVLGLGGIWNYAHKGEDGRPHLIDDFNIIDFKGRQVELIPDADFLKNQDVCHAVYRLGRMLEQKGALVKVVVLPCDELVGKLDDYLTKNSPQEFTELERIPLTHEAFSEVSKKEPPNLRTCVVDLRAFLQMEIPEKPKLFPWLPHGGLGMVYGPRGIGKTFFGLSLTISLITGTSFLKWDAPHPTGVLLVDGEMPVSHLRERIVELLPSDPTKPIQFLSGEYVFSKIGRDLNLAHEDFQSAVIEILDNQPEIECLVVDNISCLFMGLKESDKNDWEQVIPWLLALRRRNIAVLLIHHSGKNGDQRGTSGREDMLDSVIKLEQVKDEVNEGAKFIVNFTKCRGAYGSDIDPFEALLNLEVPGSWTWQPVEDSTFNRMVRLAREGVEQVKDMADELGFSKGYISRLKRKGINEGIFKKHTRIILVDGES